MKVAVIIVGKINTFDRILLDNIRRCYNLDDSSMDLFIYNNFNKTIN